MDAQEKMKVEILKNGGISVTYLFLTIFNRCMETVMVPDDLRVACIVPLIKGKVVRRKCANYRGISIMRWNEKKGEEKGVRLRINRGN